MRECRLHVCISVWESMLGGVEEEEGENEGWIRRNGIITKKSE